MGQSNVEKVLDKIEEVLNRQQEKLQLLRKNTSRIEYWEDHGDGGFWKPFTEDIVDIDNYPWKLDELRVNPWYSDNVWYLVKTDTGIRLLGNEEYKSSFIGDTVVLYKGSYEDCKDFIKV
jgi:hypothetical protein